MTLNEVADSHNVQPVLDSWYTLDGRQGDIMEPRDYPLEAVCMGCGKPIRLDRFFDQNWRHIPRFSLGAGSRPRTGEQ